MIVQRLRDIQNVFGYLPDGCLKALAKEVGLPLYKIEEVASFFPAFRQERNQPPFVEVKVCRDMTCHHRGAADLLADGGKLQTLATELTRACGKRVEVEGVSCLGRCDRAPVVWVERHDHKTTPAAPADKVAQAGATDPHKDCPCLKAKEAKGGHATLDGDHHEHGWVYAHANSPFSKLEAALRTIAAGGERPPPDTDAGYLVNTNVDRGPNGVPRWEIDVYAHRPDLEPYAAVRGVVDFATGGAAFRPPAAGTADTPPVFRIPRPPRGPGVPKGRDYEPFLERFIETDHPWLAKLKPSELLGMGGAGVKAYKKWSDVWREEGPDAPNQAGDGAEGPREPVEKYIVCNGDESEPGTFKDRELLLRTPHLVVEGVILAGLLTNATAGYIYIRHEYFEQIAACRAEVERAVKIGACGPDVFGSGRSFPVEVYESPGGYICGEQSALLEAMEDRRSQPRNRPPELTTNGFRDKPTVVNNVETVAWTPYALLNGGETYAGGGLAVKDERPARDAGRRWEQDRAGLWGYTIDPPLRFFGRRLLSVSGDVARPGVYEVPIGLPLGDLIEKPEYCGGVTGGGRIGFVATSGPSAGLTPPFIPLVGDERGEWVRRAKGLRPPYPRLMGWFLDAHLPPGVNRLDVRAIPLDLNFFRNLNEVLEPPVDLMLGAGLAVYAEGTDALDRAVNFTEFYRNESCGKCVPCRIGSAKLVGLGRGLLDRRSGAVALDVKDLETISGLVGDLTQTLGMTSICSLGVSAPTPLTTTLVYFPEQVVVGPPAARQS